MIKDQKFSCTRELGAEILMVITSFTITIVSIRSTAVELDSGFDGQDTSLFLSMGYTLFLPLMSYLFSQAKQHYSEGRAQIILIWMVFMEILRMVNHNQSTWQLQKFLEQLVRLFWVGYLVYGYAPLHGLRVSLFVLCIYFAVLEIVKAIIMNKAKNSYLIGKNPNLIHNYVKRVMLQDDLQTIPMSRCNYIVMGEEKHEIAVCNNGYRLGRKKDSTSDGMLMIGRVFQLNSEDEALTNAHPCWRDKCLSLALAKMLRRRFAKLPVDEAGCKKALDFVLEGLINYIGSSNQDIQTNENNLERKPIDRVFGIIKDELKYVTDILHTNVLAHQHSNLYNWLEYCGFFITLGTGIYLIYTIFKRSFGGLSYVARDTYSDCFFHIFSGGSMVVKLFSGLDKAITILLLVTFIYVHINRCTFSKDRWTDIDQIFTYISNNHRRQNRPFRSGIGRSGAGSDGTDPERERNRPFRSGIGRYHFGAESAVSTYIRNHPDKWTIPIRFQKLFRNLEGENVKKATIYSSVLDLEAETILFCIKVNVSTLMRFPKCIRRNIRRSFPTVIHGTDAKEAILASLKKSVARLSVGETSLGNFDEASLLTNGKTSLENYNMESLNWACTPNGSTTEAILVWHIATTLFHHQESSPQQNNDPHQEPATHENNNSIKKKQEVALALSSYCHYLVKSLPELLPEQADWTEEMYESVTKEILGAIPRSGCKKPTKDDHYNYVLLHAGWVESSVVGKGVKLANQLMDYDKERKPVWAMLAEFWAEMMLFIAPSDNVDGHEKILYRLELITQLWALLTHAGIVTGSKPTDHQVHDSESNAFTENMNV